MTTYKKDIFDLFDENTSDALRMFCKNINQSDADVFIVMAHKAICLFNILQEQNYIDIGNRSAISNFSLDFEIENLKDKKIVIVDDIMISGTAVSSTVNKATTLCGVDKNNISVIVLAVDTCYMRMQFINELQENVLKCNKYLSNDECIKLSSNISNAFSYYGIPYDYDFPIYNNIRIDSDRYNALFNNFFWDLYNTTNDYHIKGDVTSYLLIPKKVFLNEFYKTLGIKFINSVRFEIKVYIKHYMKNEKECTISPLCVFNEMEQSNIDKLFEALTPYHSKNDYSTEAKVRYIQFYLSHKLFLQFNKEISLVFNENINQNSMNALFGSAFGNRIYNKLLNDSNCNNDKKMAIKCENIDSNIYNDFIEKSNKSNTELSLLRPFMWWYDNKEIPVRNYFKENPTNFLTDYELIISKKLKRLKSGFSFKTLVKIFNITSENDENALSIFINRAIELGILVPTIYYNKEKRIACRVYRHGEDLPFALADQIRLLKFLLSLEQKIKNINRSWDSEDPEGGIAHVSFEKMIVAFYQIGLKQGNIFNRFLGFDNIDIMKPFLSVHGRVNAFVSPKDIKRKGIEEHFYSEKIQVENEEYEYIKWLSKWLNDKNFIYITGKDNKTRVFIEKERIIDYINSESRNNIDKNICEKIDAIGTVISKWYNFRIENGGKDEFKKDATALTSCENIYVFSSAIATEIHYFKSYWNKQAKEAFETDCFSENNFAYQVIEQALKSGRDKKGWYDVGRAKEVINTISNKIFKDQLFNWADFWNVETEQRYPVGYEITEKLYEAIGYLYFYSACYDYLKYDGFWEENKYPNTFFEYKDEYEKQCKMTEKLENNLFDIFDEIMTITDINKKRKKVREEISKVIPCSEKTVNDIEKCIKSSHSIYTVRYRSSLIFEINPICAKTCDEHIMRVWNNLKEDDNKTQLNIVRFSNDCGNDKYIRYGLFFGIIKNNTYTIEYKSEMLINLFDQLCKELNCRAYSIRAILLPQIPSGLIFEHNTYQNINAYSKEFYNNVVSTLETMFVDNKYHQLILVTTDYTPSNTCDIVKQLEWDNVINWGSQAFTFFPRNTYITKYLNETIQLSKNPDDRVNNSIVKITTDNSSGLGLLVKAKDQVICVTCNHIIKDSTNIVATTLCDNITFTLIPIKEIISEINGLSAEQEIAILEPQWNGRIPINIEQLVSLNDFSDEIEGKCDCCGFSQGAFQWESGIEVSRLIVGGYMQTNNVENIECGFSGGVIINGRNKIVGIHEGRFHTEKKGKIIPSSIIINEIHKILGDNDYEE